jgi:hypothetical protein
LIAAQVIKKLVNIEPYKVKLKSLSILGMLGVVFFSGISNSKHLLTNYQEVAISCTFVLVYYLLALLVALSLSRLFSYEDKVTVFYTLFLKNITIALGISLLLKPGIAFYFVVAYLIQIPVASLMYHKLGRESVPARYQD